MSGHDYTRHLYSALQELVDVEPLDRRKMVRGMFDIVHVHWERPVALAGPWPNQLLWALAIRVAKLRGARVVLTLHNLRPHDETLGPVDRFFLGVFDRAVDGVILHGPTAARLIDRHRPGLRNAQTMICGHGPFIDYERAVVASGSAADAVRLLSFGTLRPYKGLEELVDVAKETSGVSLTVLGSGRDERFLTSLAERCADDDNVQLDLRLSRVPNRDVERAAVLHDALMLNYRDVLTSGAAVLGLTLGLPVVAPRIGLLPDLLEDVGPEWLFLFTPPLTPAKLEEAAQWVRARVASGPPPLPTWEQIALATHSFYQEVIGPSETSRSQGVSHNEQR